MSLMTLTMSRDIIFSEVYSLMLTKSLLDVVLHVQTVYDLMSALCRVRTGLLALETLENLVPFVQAAVLEAIP